MVIFFKLIELLLYCHSTQRVSIQLKGLELYEPLDLVFQKKNPVFSLFGHQKTLIA